MLAVLESLQNLHAVSSSILHLKLINSGVLYLLGYSGVDINIGIENKRFA